MTQKDQKAVVLRAISAIACGLMAMTVGCAGPDASGTTAGKPAGTANESTAKLNPTSVLPPVTLQSLLERVQKSLVVVRYTVDTEGGRRELEGPGIVVKGDGTVALPLGLTPMVLPDSQLTAFKLVIPAGIEGLDPVEIDAELLGRDERSDLAFVRAKPKPDDSPRTWTPLEISQAKVTVGDVVHSVGLLSKGSGYTPYARSATLSTHLRGPTPLALVAGGLTVAGSPVFDARGAWIGIVAEMPSQSPLLNGNDEQQRMPLMVPPAYFVPLTHHAISLNDLPKPGETIVLPWLGVSQMTGLAREVAEFYGVADAPAIQVGDVIPGFSADRAGMKSGDVIIRLNGQPLERGDLPEELPMILGRTINRLKVGQNVTLDVVREPKGTPLSLTLNLDPRPALASSASRYWDETLGLSVRDLVFNDRYARKLDNDFAGVMVVFVKPGSAAQSGQLGRNDIITKLNQIPVENLDQFEREYKAFRTDKPTEPLVLEVLRGTDTQIVRIEPPR
jgi:S1-C subfamily serine protease